MSETNPRMFEYGTGENAFLRDASTDLYWALDEVTDFIESLIGEEIEGTPIIDDDEPMLLQARAALAKARGEPIKPTENKAGETA